MLYLRGSWSILDPMARTSAATSPQPRPAMRRAPRGNYPRAYALLWPGAPVNPAEFADMYLDHGVPGPLPGALLAR